MKLLDRYIISLNLFVLLLVLSLVFTDFYRTNIIEYSWMSFAFVFSVFIIEYSFNKAGYEKREKAKKIYFYIMPIFLVVFTITGYFILL